MHNFTLNHADSAAKVLRHLRFLTRRTGARPETASLHTQLSAALTQLKAQMEALEAAEEDTMDTVASKGALDEDLDVLMADLVARALLEVGRDRSHASFLAAFPSAPSQAMKDLASEAQGRFAQNALTVLGTDPVFAGLATYLAPVQAALDAVTAIVATEAAQRAAQELESARLAAVVRSAVDTYNTGHPSLKLLFPNRKGLVNSFYLTTKQAKGEEA